MQQTRVHTQQQAEHAMWLAYVFLFERGIDIVNYGDVRVKVEAHIRGCSDASRQTIGRYTLRVDGPMYGCDIVVKDGLTMAYAMVTLVHELVHYWLSYNDIKPSSNMAEEAVCELVGCVAAESIVEHELQRHQARLAHGYMQRCKPGALEGVLKTMCDKSRSCETLVHRLRTIAATPPTPNTRYY
jgi:hypothetical protein